MELEEILWQNKKLELRKRQSKNRRYRIAGFITRQLRGIGLAVMIGTAIGSTYFLIQYKAVILNTYKAKKQEVKNEEKLVYKPKTNHAIESINHAPIRYEPTNIKSTEIQKPNLPGVYYDILVHRLK